MKKAVWIGIFLIFLEGILLKGYSSEDEKSGMRDLLPKEIKSWKANEKDKVYDSKTIFDYIDGGGEVYRSYNFRKLLVRRYLKKGKADIIADLFDMGSSNDAFGVFTHDLEGEEEKIGQGSTYQGGLLSFWKGRFFVSLYAEEETEETKAALLALGRKVDASIKREGKKPGIVSLFPPDELNKKSIRYFHNHMILNYHFFVADENILLLDQKSEAALGNYGEASKNFHLLIIRYPEVKKAPRAYKNFKEIYMPDALESGLVRTENLKWTAAKVKDEFLVIIFNAPSDSLAKKMIESVESEIEKEGN